MLKRSIVLGFLVAVAACSNGSTTPDLSRNDSLVTVSGPLRLDVEDFITSGGVLWALPNVSATSGTINVTSTQYGSLCRTAVDGSAQINGRSVALRIKFVERLTSCTAEIRALRYHASITAPAGAYDVTVIHEYNGKPDTLAVRSVTVP